METHSNILAWEMPQTDEPGGLVRGVTESEATGRIRMPQCTESLPRKPSQKGRVRKEGHKACSYWHSPGQLGNDPVLITSRGAWGSLRRSEDSGRPWRAKAH